jgi:hypothetical protein
MILLKPVFIIAIALSIVLVFSMQQAYGEVSSNPSWVDELYSWYDYRLIEKSQLSNALIYLQDNDIIKIEKVLTYADMYDSPIECMIDLQQKRLYTVLARNECNKLDTPPPVIEETIYKTAEEIVEERKNPGIDNSQILINYYRELLVNSTAVNPIIEIFDSPKECMIDAYNTNGTISVYDKVRCDQVNRFWQQAGWSDDTTIEFDYRYGDEYTVYPSPPTPGAVYVETSEEVWIRVTTSYGHDFNRISNQWINGEISQNEALDQLDVKASGYAEEWVNSLP